MRLNVVPAAIAAMAALLSAAPASAALKAGARAPDFTTQGAIAGKTFSLHLKEALKKGPVVLYFFPAAFTSGCTIEAHAFSEATDRFKAAGATVIGMSGDDIGKLKDFSVKECRNKFAVASASPAVIKAYDVTLGNREGVSDRTSYVIAPDGRITYAYSEMNPADHVKNTLAAVKKLTVK